MARRNEFDLSHEHKTSVDMGTLIPVMAEEVLPGDTFLHRASALARVAPLAKPLMHRVELRMHSFYIPNRIIWDEVEREEVDFGVPFTVPFRWEEFITGHDETMAPPIVACDGGALWDHLGVPPGYSGDIDWTPLIACNLVWNEYYRDQDLQTKRALNDSTLPRICWQKDYFTVARPKPQQSDPESMHAWVQSDLEPDSNVTVSALLKDGSRALFDTSGTQLKYSVGVSGLKAGQLYADVDIQDLRRSIALQRFAEARMRFGHRYVDYLRYCGVNPSDGRLSRPEYLGGGKQVLNFSEVLATADGASTNVGDMYGHGIGMGNSGLYRKFFEEHGWVITFLSARPKTVYSDAVPRKFLRKTAMDYYQKELEIMPWQEVRMNEVHKDGSEQTIFGYVPRYEEYRHSTSQVSGTLRGGTENDWHMAREFSTPPALNGSFVECTPTERIYSDASMPDLIVNVMHSLRKRSYVGQTASMGTKL